MFLKGKNKVLTRCAEIFFSAAFWIIVWFLLAKRVDRELLLPRPLTVLERLLELMAEPEFYTTCLSSLARVLTGIIFGIFCGILFGIATSAVRILDRICSPLFSVIKSTPVASFIMLAMLWIEKSLLPSFITFLIVFPLAWANTSEGIKSASAELLEIATVHRMGIMRKAVHIYLPTLIPFFISTARSALGLAWKAGIAAEVLAVPERAIGSNIYNSKIFLETTDLFVWTLVTVLLSILLESVIGWLLSKLKAKYSFRSEEIKDAD